MPVHILVDDDKKSLKNCILIHLFFNLYNELVFNISFCYISLDKKKI